MKNNLALALCALILLTSVSAHADVDLANYPILAEPSLLEPIQQTEYRTWILYQPVAMETREDVIHDNGFQYRRFFPVVAEKDGTAVLILLQKVDEQWTIYGINATALNRPGLTLFRFMLDPIDAKEQAEGPGLPIEFVFREADRRIAYQFHMTATDIETTRFTYLNIIGVEGLSSWAVGDIYPWNITIDFNDGYRFTYSFDWKTISKNFDIHLITDESSHNNFSRFDLSKVSLSILDLMDDSIACSKQSINDGKILMYESGTESSNILCEIPAGSLIMREVSSNNYADQEFILVAYEQLMGYLHKSNIVLNLEVESLQKALKGTAYEGYKIESYDRNLPPFDQTYKYAMAVAVGDGKNVLCVFISESDGWKLHSAGESALYAGDILPTIFIDPNRPVTYIQYPNTETRETVQFWADEKIESISWRLYEYSIYETEDGIEIPLQVRWSDSQKLWQAIWPDRYSEYIGEAVIDLQSFDIRAFPKTEEQANAQWSLVYTESHTPKSKTEIIATLNGLSGEIMQFRPDEEYAVYSGPGEHYLRAASGKAKVSTNGPIEVVAIENGWIMIRYEISNGISRFGYIPERALVNQTVNINTMPVGEIAKLLVDCNVTDDPLGTRSSLRKLDKGTPVDVLGIFGEWAYIDDSMSQDEPCRGFVPVDSIEFTANF